METNRRSLSYFSPGRVAKLAIILVSGLTQLQALAQNGAEVNVEWPCRTRTGQVQDEYCEWRKSTLADGKLRCTYTSTFDSARQQFLTQTNQFNSKPFLVQLIIACTAQKRCNGTDCVPTRQADPAVCQAVTNIKNSGCNVAVKGFGKSTPTDSSEKIRLFKGIGPEDLFCKFVADPLTGAKDETLLQCDIPVGSAYKSCESLAESVFARAVLVKNSCN